VGCVAAQSVGEPSTQMTLNTFHLAGHGGANVTLGIPRLREIIMTASKMSKTPTMLLPLPKGATMAAAKALARRLSRLKLTELLSHRAGVSVGEQLKKDVGGWKRHYRVRFQFESPARIKEIFEVSFDEITEVVRSGVLKKIFSLITREKRRLGEVSSKESEVSFLSKGGDKVKRENGDGEEEDGETKIATRSSNEVDHLLDGEEEDADGDLDSDDDRGEVDRAGYEDDDSVINDEAVSQHTGTTPEDATATDADSIDSDNEDRPAASIAAKVSTTTVSSGQLSRHNAKEGWVELMLVYPASARRLLMVQLAEEAAANVSVRVTKDIANAYAIQTELDGQERVAVQTEGVNFGEAWQLGSAVDCSEIMSNDVFSILMTYGVEAARRSIVSEIVGVFNVYGINVNLRHLSLIADAMTRSGDYIPMNRLGMNHCASPLLQMSFETTCTFLSRAADEGLADSMESPSARIVLGKVPKLGTGAFDLLTPVEHRRHLRS
jgi:DNA-directed RNA polymerase I subunit RPA1